MLYLVISMLKLRNKYVIFNSKYAKIKEQICLNLIISMLKIESVY